MIRTDDRLPAPRGKTRNDILNALKRADGLTVGQIAGAVGVSAMAVRKHLAALEQEDLVRSEPVRRPIGRPARAYRLTEESDSLFPSGYDSIAVEFLSDLVMMDGPEKVDLLFNRRADRTYAYLEARVSRARTFDERVAALATGMDELGYLTQWEKTGPDSWAVRQHNCAIQKVAMTFPQACYYELETYRRLLDAEVERSCHLIAGDHMCSYVIRPRRPAGAES